MSPCILLRRLVKETKISTWWMDRSTYVPMDRSTYFPIYSSKKTSDLNVNFLKDGLIYNKKTSQPDPNGLSIFGPRTKTGRAKTTHFYSG